MSKECEFIALPGGDSIGGLVCTTCAETFEKEPVCPKQAGGLPEPGNIMKCKIRAWAICKEDDNRYICFTDDIFLDFKDALEHAVKHELMVVPLFSKPLDILPEYRSPVGGLDYGWAGEYNRGWNDCINKSIENLDNI